MLLFIMYFGETAPREDIPSRLCPDCKKPLERGACPTKGCLSSRICFLCGGIKSLGQRTCLGCDLQILAWF